MGLPELEPGTSYQGGRTGSVECRDVRKCSANNPISGFYVKAPVRRVPPRAARVGVAVGVNGVRQPPTLGGWRDFRPGGVIVNHAAAS